MSGMGVLVFVNNLWHLRQRRSPSKERWVLRRSFNELLNHTIYWSCGKFSLALIYYIFGIGKLSCYRVQAALAGACANLHALPEKLNPVVRPLMESIKKEPSEDLQAISAESLAALLGQLATRESGPNNKVLVNLKAFLRWGSLLDIITVPNKLFWLLMQSIKMAPTK